ncbi:MAG: HD-GYP domain-containing protein [Spirochaetaceae bacterium]|jgi:HD-GYP domain-containing protein (c-di-GMP phosphodiesterase class II)|nr:HD-GYP domain-containing protein [Spirochaetaceae bacterium]
MKSVLTRDLKENVKYTQPLYVDDSVFLPADVVITKKDLDMLEKLSVMEVFTDGRPVNVSQETGPDALDGAALGEPDAAVEEILNNLPNEAEGNLIFDRLEKEVKLLDGVFELIAAKKIVKSRILWTIVATVLQLIKKDRNSCVEFILGCNITGFEAAKSSINTAIITALISIELGFAETVVPEFVSAALLHDAGMLRIPKTILNKKTPLTTEEKLMIQGHSVASFHIVQDELHYQKTVSWPVLQHHERWDGLGYPLRLSGESIDRGACIVAVADAFEAMVSKKSYRNSMMAYHAMKTMMSESISHFSPKALKAFVQIMGVYPIASGVILNNNLKARVLMNNKDAPLRPIVKIISDVKGNPNNNGNVINLLTDRTLFITSTFNLNS